MLNFKRIVFLYFLNVGSFLSIRALLLKILLNLLLLTIVIKDTSVPLQVLCLFRKAFKRSFLSLAFLALNPLIYFLSIYTSSIVLFFLAISIVTSSYNTLKFFKNLSKKKSKSNNRPLSIIKA